MSKSPSRWFAETETQVQFNHLDPMEIVWRSRPSTISKSSAAFAHLNHYNYPQMKASGYVWPVIDLHVRYIAPVSSPKAQAAPTSSNGRTV
jgi:acyl-CoA thioester hydrolase